jgi:hypothetical protein
MRPRRSNWPLPLTESRRHGAWISSQERRWQGLAFSGSARGIGLTFPVCVVYSMSAILVSLPRFVGTRYFVAEDDWEQVRGLDFPVPEKSLSFLQRSTTEEPPRLPRAAAPVPLPGTSFAALGFLASPESGAGIPVNLEGTKRNRTPFCRLEALPTMEMLANDRGRCPRATLRWSGKCARFLFSCPQRTKS